MCITIVERRGPRGRSERSVGQKTKEHRRKRKKGGNGPNNELEQTTGRTKKKKGGADSKTRKIEGIDGGGVASGIREDGKPTSPQTKRVHSKKGR